MTTEQEVSEDKFVEILATDLGISPKKERKLKLPIGKSAVRNFTSSVAKEVRIFDGKIEHPYMLGEQRNEKAFANGVELRVFTNKNLMEIIEEGGVILRKIKCKICDGGGWYHEGLRYFYKNYYVEI